MFEYVCSTSRFDGFSFMHRIAEPFIGFVQIVFCCKELFSVKDLECPVLHNFVQSYSLDRDVTV